LVSGVFLKLLVGHSPAIPRHNDYVIDILDFLIWCNDVR